MGSDAFHHGHIARRALRDRVVILVGDIRFGDQDAADAGAGIGSILVTKADVANEDYDAIAQRAARYVAVVESV